MPHSPPPLISSDEEEEEIVGAFRPISPPPPPPPAPLPLPMPEHEMRAHVPNYVMGSDVGVWWNNTQDVLYLYWGPVNMGPLAPSRDLVPFYDGGMVTVPFMESFDRDATHIDNLFWVVIDDFRTENTTVTMTRDEAIGYYGRLSRLVYGTRGEKTYLWVGFGWSWAAIEAVHFRPTLYPYLRVRHCKSYVPNGAHM